MSFAPDLVLEVRNSFIYQQETPVLKEVNFNISKGEFVYIIGRTGSGKSSLLKTLYADLPFNSGEIVVAGHRINGIARKEVPELRRKIGIVFQDFQLLMDRSVEENLLFVMKATGWTDRAKIKQQLSNILMRVGLGSLGAKLPHQLSGGEQQRVAIARSLINDLQLLIADEPTGNLDPQVADGILKLFKEINSSGTAILMATHNHTFLENHPARVLKCSGGSIFDSKTESFSFTDIW